MKVIALTLLVSLCLAGIFIIAFACEMGRKRRRSLERESLPPFDDDDLAAFEKVRMLTPPPAVETARALCSEGVEIIPWDLDDAWMRDTGPTFLKHADSGRIAGTDSVLLV